MRGTALWHMRALPKEMGRNHRTPDTKSQTPSHTELQDDMRPLFKEMGGKHGKSWLWSRLWEMFLCDKVSGMISQTLAGEREIRFQVWFASIRAPTRSASGVPSCAPSLRRDFCCLPGSTCVLAPAPVPRPSHAPFPTALKLHVTRATPQHQFHPRSCS